MTKAPFGLKERKGKERTPMEKKEKECGRKWFPSIFFELSMEGKKRKY